MFRNMTDSKQKTLTDFLSKSKEDLQTNNNKDVSKNAYRRSGVVYLESSSSDEENVNAPIGNSQLQCSGSFVPSPRNYKFSSIEDIIKEDKNYQNALDKIKKNLNEPMSNIKRVIEKNSFLDDSISPIKSQKAESKLLAKYMSGSSRKEECPQLNNDIGECIYYTCCFVLLSNNNIVIDPIAQNVC